MPHSDAEIEASLTFLNRRISKLEEEVKWLRQRVASIWPERSYCPKCRALVHKASVACGACGATWGEKRPEDEGLPR